MVLHLITEHKVGPLTAKQDELLQAARDDTDRLHVIVENLLDMSRIESGRALMELRPVPPEALVTNAIQSLASSFQAQDVSLCSQLEAGLPLVLADLTRIGHVFANLLMNSLRHTPAGGQVNIGARAVDDVVEFVVSDTGCGIPKQYLHRVFDKFFRVPGQSSASGSGLGLAIAKDIVEAHGGHIRVDGRDGIGTTVAFSLRRCNGSSASQ
jgi:signal transduction histidine kinase